MKKNLLLLLFLLFSDFFAQSYTIRHSYNQKLEPVNKILHGAGQDSDGFSNYFNLMESNQKPIVYMYYNHINNIGTTWAKHLKKELISYGENTIVVQFGLELTGVLSHINDGHLDDAINDLLDGCTSLGLPIYMRIGYEFNGYSWNGYDPGPYKNAFIYITNKIRERDLEIATIWNYAPDGLSNYMDFYPGDRFVDWWSINIFSASHVSNPTSIAFINDAEMHNRPVLIGESTPRYVGVLDGASDWNDWFVPFYNFLKTQPSIKMTGYINWNWANWSQWANWGDARLESNEYVKNQFKAELGDTIYFHSSTEKDFRKQLGYSENIPPGIAQNLIVVDDQYPLKLMWDPVDDESKIARYLIYRDNELIDFTANTEITLSNFEPLDTVFISIGAVDRAGNYGGTTLPLEIIIPPNEGEPGNKIINGDFDLGKSGWNLNHYVSNVDGIFNIDTTGVLSGPNSAHIVINKNTQTNWHLQFQQFITIKKNKQYIISYQAKSAEPTNIETWLQQDHDPYFGYSNKSISLNTEAKTFIDTTSITEQDDDVYMTFMLGNSKLTEIWIDSISVVEYEIILDNDETELIFSLPSEFNLSNAYPNPFNNSTRIEFTLQKAGYVKLSLYSLIGEKLYDIAYNEFDRGTHYILINAAELSSGIYFYTVQYKDELYTKKIILLK